MYEKIKKRYTLNRSYFKLRGPLDPRTPLECLKYREEHGERPFDYGDHGFDETVEFMHDQYLDRNSSDMKYFDQYYTPLKVSKRIAELVNDWFPDAHILQDACCGYGSLATYIKKEIYGFDIYLPNAEFTKKTGFYSGAIQQSYKDMNNLGVDLTISNPPYGKSNTTTRDFLSYVKTDIILIAPLGLERDVKKKYLPIRGNFDLVYREEIKEEFSQTKTKTCFYILKYKGCKK